MDTGSIYAAAKELLDRFDLAGRRVRLTGVAVAGLYATDATETLPLLPDASADRKRRLEEVVAAVSERFGRAAMKRAARLEADAPRAIVAPSRSRPR